jgi:hypothetical protein
MKEFRNGDRNGEGIRIRKSGHIETSFQLCTDGINAALSPEGCSGFFCVRGFGFILGLGTSSMGFGHLRVGLLAILSGMSRTATEKAKLVVKTALSFLLSKFAIFP